MKTLHKYVFAAIIGFIIVFSSNAFVTVIYREESEEICDFNSQFGFIPFRYCFHDNDKRFLFLDFLGKNTLQISNKPQKDRKNLSFTDVYKFHLDTLYRQSKYSTHIIMVYVIIDKLIYTDTDITECKQVVKPFHDDRFETSMSVFGTIENDTIRIVQPGQEAMYVGKAFFSIVRPHQLGMWIHNPELVEKTKKYYMRKNQWILNGYETDYKIINLNKSAPIEKLIEQL